MPSALEVARDMALESTISPSRATSSHSVSCSKGFGSIWEALIPPWV